MNELIEYIKQANELEEDIEDVRLMQESKNVKVTQLESFLNHLKIPTQKKDSSHFNGETGYKSFIIEQRYPDIIQYACNKGLDPYSLCYYLSDKDGSGLNHTKHQILKSN